MLGWELSEAAEKKITVHFGSPIKCAHHYHSNFFFPLRMQVSFQAIGGQPAILKWHFKRRFFIGNVHITGDRRGLFDVRAGRSEPESGARSAAHNARRNGMVSVRYHTKLITCEMRSDVIGRKELNNSPLVFHHASCLSSFRRTLCLAGFALHTHTLNRSFPINSFSSRARRTSVCLLSLQSGRVVGESRSTRASRPNAR